MSQIPTVLDLLQQIHPRNMLDVGKGFGKYGFLVHEYFGIPTAVRPDPGRMLREQSTVVIDAVEFKSLLYVAPPGSYLPQDLCGKGGATTQTIPALWSCSDV